MEGFERINKLIYCLILGLMVYFDARFVHSYILTGLAIGFFLIVILSNVYTLFIKKGFHIQISENEIYGRKNNKYTFDITFVNKKILPIINIAFDVSMENRFTETNRLLTFRASAPAMGKRKVSIDLTPLYCGQITIKITNVKLNDALSFFATKTNIEKTFVFFALPEEKRGQNTESAGESLAEESKVVKKLVNGSETLDIKEYVPGDSIKLIHWKLSSKKDELYIKEKGTDVLNTPVVVLDLPREDFSLVFDILYTTLINLVNTYSTVRFFYKSEKKEEIVQKEITDTKVLPKIFAELYSCVAINANTLFAAKKYIGSGTVIYIHSPERAEMRQI
ncbi:MAG: DUF58 domain-containing protein [Firmicutes bacterium]|nr:DUF58 domain-containing protein [Bacillota bacterium]